MPTRRFARLLAPFTLLASTLPVAAIAAVVAVVGAPSAPVHAAGEQVAMGQTISTPAALSTSGDFATDTFSNPWDFNDTDDVNPTEGVGVLGSSPAATVAGGLLTVNAHNGTEIRPLMEWPGVLPWGHDGWAYPIDSSIYTQLDMYLSSTVATALQVRWKNAAGQLAITSVNLSGDGAFHQYHLNLADPSIYLAGFNPGWSGPIPNFVFVVAGGTPTLQFDWVRIHRADASATPPVGVPVAHVLSPNIEGGADFATTEQGNAWDFTSSADVVATNDIQNAAFTPSGMTGTTVGNDGWVQVPLTAPLDTDRYHRMTVSACYSGTFGLGGSPGQGMIGRLTWQVPTSPLFATTQDFVVFPGPCQRMTIDLATTPASAVNDEASSLVTGWRGIQPSFLRFDLNEDPGVRNFTLQGLKLADDASFTDTYPITFTDEAGAGGATANIYATTNQGQFDGTLIGSMPVSSTAGAVNTFKWDGTSKAGAPMPNASYWIYVVMTNTAGTGTGYATGPLREQKVVPLTPSFFVPLTPARVLDTRNGIGGNIFPLQTGGTTELPVTGVGGVPATNVTAVVMNVTVTNTTQPGYLTAWPSGDPQPTVSNLNFVPNQTVPNLVTVKVGDNGRVNLFNSAGSTDVLADVMGYYTSVLPPGGGRFTALTPFRLLDTRKGVGTGGVIAPVGPNSHIDLTVTGVGGVPASGVSAVALNVTADQPTQSGYLTVWPTGEPQPTASTHNFVPGLTIANLVLAKVGAGGQISIYNLAGSTQVVADVIGYFSTSGGAFIPVAPQRLINTRDGTGTTMAPLGQSDQRTLAIATGAPVPRNATAVVVNVTSADSTAQSFVTVWPTGSLQPVASTMNPQPGVPVPNQAYLRLGTAGSLDVFNNTGSTAIIIDVFGYVVPPT